MQKKPFIKIRTLLCLGILFIGQARAQDSTWTLVGRAPQENEIRLDHLWNVEIVNAHSEPIDVYMVGEVRDESGRLVFRGTSRSITLPPGGRKIDPSDISDVSGSWLISDFERAFERDGRLPNGVYRICTTVFSARDRKPFCTNCMRATAGAEQAEPLAGKAAKNTGSPWTTAGDHPVITVTYPTHSTVYHNFTNQTDVIKWTSKGTVNDSVRIDLIPCWNDTDILPDVTITSGTENDGEYTWSRDYPDKKIKAWPFYEGKYQVRVTADIAKKVYGESDTILFDDPFCGLEFLLPEDGDEICPGETYEFHWTPKAVSGQVPIDLEVYDTTQNKELLNKTVWNTGSYEWLVPSAIGSQSKLKSVTCRVEIKSQDEYISDTKYASILKNCRDLVGVWQIVFRSNPHPTLGPMVVLFRGDETSGTAHYLDSSGSYTLSGTSVTWKTTNNSYQYHFSGTLYSVDVIQGTMKIYMDGTLKWTELVDAFRVDLPQ